MKKVLLVVIFILLCFPVIKVNAFTCPFSEISRLRRIVNNINTSIDYREGNGTIDFLITLVNLHSDIYLIDSNGRVIEYTDSQVTLSGYGSGENVRFEAHTRITYCEDIFIGTIRVNLPVYNPFYRDAVCRGLENFRLCSKWSNHGLSYSDFVRAVNEYRASLENPVINEENPREVSFFEILLEVINIYYTILIIIIISGSLGIYVLKRKEYK